jgi:hypothetical protein
MKLRRKCLQVAPFNGPLLIAALLLVSPARAAGENAEATTVTTSGAAAPAAMTESQREAAAVLDRMATYLAGLQSFTVTFRAGYDVVQATGQKIEFGETRHVTMARPSQLRVEEVASDGNRDLALFDGRNMTVMNADSGVFAQAAQPGTVDDALVYFVRDLKMRMPLALLLTTRLPGELPQRVKTIDYVEYSDVYGVPTHHIAGRTDTVDFQFWITEGEHPLPLRVVITYRQAEGQPQYWANFSDWNTSPALTKTTFQFTPPTDARQIAFAVQVPKPIGTPRPAAANGEIQP